MGFFYFIEPVAVSKLPDIVSEYYGQTLSIQCTVRGKPQPTITWYRKSVVINSLTYPDIQITTTAKDNTTVQSGITITSVTDTDEGIYTCSGSNTLPNGTVTNVRSFTLKVTGSKTQTIKHLYLPMCILLDSHSNQLHWNCPEFNSYISFMVFASSTRSQYSTLYHRNR